MPNTELLEKMLVINSNLSNILPNLNENNLHEKWLLINSQKLLLECSSWLTYVEGHKNEQD